VEFPVSTRGGVGAKREDESLTSSWRDSHPPASGTFASKQRDI
jgi:hypothetical protein